MKRIDPSIVIGLLLILAGGLFALQTRGILNNAGDLFWGAIFIAAGLLFLLAFFTGSWWAVIPGLTLAGIGAQILLPDPLEKFGDSLFLGSIALAFWLVYVAAPRGRWWSLIPAGALTTLAVVALLPDMLDDRAAGSIFFFGLAVTFLLVAVLAGMRWARYPAVALGLMGAVVLLALGGIASYLWAALLIGTGAFLVYRSFRPA